VGAIIGFLIFNFHPAKVFMGDSGSLFVGFLLAAMATQGSVKRHIMIPMVALAIPIIDTLMAILRRWSRGLPMSVPDRLHVHHRLIKMGFSQLEAVLLLYGICIILGCAALVIAVSDAFWPVLMATVTIVAVLGVGVAMLGGKEIGAVPSLIVKAMRRRRRRGRAWVTVYNTVAKLENSSNLGQMWHDLGDVLEELDLDSARVCLEMSLDGPKEFAWTREDAKVTMDDEGRAEEGWTAQLSLEDNGRHLGRLVLGKDTRRSPLPDGLAEMIDVLRWEVVKALLRLEGAGSVTPGTGSATVEGRPAGENA
jgi:UDP-GlcNAc:undecaprenyl-phosphate GlcNAc-1-phosphate transferase